MSPNPKRLTTTGKIWLVAVIIISFILAYLLLFCPPQAEATQTTRLELKEVGGSYDGNVVLTRAPGNTFLFTTPLGTVELKDGTITITANIIADGGYIGITTNPTLLLLEATLLTLSHDLTVKGEALIGSVGTPGRVRLLNISAGTNIDLEGSDGDATFKGGVNVGTETGAVAGEIETETLQVSGTGYISAIYFAANQIYNTAADDFYFKSKKDLVFRPDADNNGTNKIIFQAGDATEVGSIDESGNAQFDGTLDAAFLQALPSTAALPTASDALCGTLYVKRDAAGVVPDRLYICLRDLDSLGYTWVLIASGP